jgi:hypothetical protein
VFIRPRVVAVSISSSKVDSHPRLPSAGVGTLKILQSAGSEIVDSDPDHLTGCISVSLCQRIGRTLRRQ